MMLSLHSFTPSLAAHPDQARPWHVGVLYNEDDRLAAAAIAALEAEGMVVGDQQPYSGKLLNATMNRHAEANFIPYVGIEMRQDLVGDAAGQGLLERKRVGEGKSVGASGESRRRRYIKKKK